MEWGQFLDTADFRGPVRFNFRIAESHRVQLSSWASPMRSPSCSRRSASWRVGLQAWLEKSHQPDVAPNELDVNPVIRLV